MTGPPDQPRATVLHLFGPPPAVEGAPAKAERTGFCYPHHPILDEVSRTVACERCKAKLDSFDVLLQVARRHEEWTRLGNESSVMRREIEALKAEEKRVKARTKSHARKDAAEAVAAERAKLGRELAEIACRTDDARRALTRIDQLVGRTVAVGRGHIARILARDEGGQ